MTTTKVRITGFEKYKGRGDVKHNSWFRLSNRFLEDHEFFDFTHEEKLVWIYLLSIASQKNTSDITVSHQHAQTVCTLSSPGLNSAIEKLSKLGCLEIQKPRTSRGRYANVTDACATRHNITGHTEQNTTVPASPPAPVNVVLNSEIWKSYSDAYFLRYGTEPVRNARVNSQIKQIGQNLGSEAPEVVRFYVSHNNAFYVRGVHKIGLCLADAEALRTQWATNTKVTNREAQQAENADTLAAQMKRLGEK